ncbi:MAG: lipoprotein [Bacteroidota bacterium]
MKKYNLFFLFIILLLSACQSADKTDEKENSVKDEQTEISREKTVSKAEQPAQKESPAGIEAWPEDVTAGEQYTSMVRFDQMVANSDGMVYIFRDKEENRYEMWRESEFTSGLEFTQSLMPNKIYEEYDNKWFEMTWEIREKEMYDGYTGEWENMLVPVVENLKPLEK